MFNYRPTPNFVIALLILTGIAIVVFTVAA